MWGWACDTTEPTTAVEWQGRGDCGRGYCGTGDGGGGAWEASMK